MRRHGFGAWSVVLVTVACGKAPEAAPAAVSSTPPQTKVLENVGFKTPESVLHDATADVYLVSNIQGSPLDKDDNGFISRLSPDGTVLALKWIDGAAAEVQLDAPKGMGLSAGTLYVADITSVRMFDAVSGAAKGSIAIAGSSFLNDVAVGADGAVYVSDSGLAAGEGGFAPTGTDAVYRVAPDGKVTKLNTSAELGRPNGLAVGKAGVLVVTFGANELFLLDGAGVKQPVAKLPAGGLDGLVLLRDGRAVITSWESKSVYIQGADGAFVVLASGLESPADLGLDEGRARVLVPLFQLDKVVLQPL